MTESTDDMLKISCIMPTYNRLRIAKSGEADMTIVEESIESFLRQDYPHKELIIVNDTPGQKLQIDPKYGDMIRIFNLPKRMPTLGHKYRFGVSQSSGDYITPWDDDDIMMPDRLTRCRQHVQGADILIVHGLYAMQQDGSFRFDAGSGFAADWFKKSHIQQWGYHLSSFGSDAETRKLLRDKADLVKRLQPNIDWHFYIYRWSTTRRPHLSGFGKNGYDIIGQMPIVKVEYNLEPKWLLDYPAMIEQFRQERRDAKVARDDDNGGPDRK